MRCLRSIWLTTCILLVGNAAGLWAAAPNFDGRDWRQADAQFKQLYVQGFLSGVVAGQDRLTRQFLMPQSGPDFRPECHPAVVKAANALESQLARMDPARFIAALDAFYEREENRKQPLKWTVLLLMQQIQGAPAEALEQYIESLRRTP